MSRVRSVRLSEDLDTAVRQVGGAVSDISKAAMIDEAKELLTDNGYVVLKAASYRKAQERQRVAECYRDSEIRAAESARAWARDCLTEERRLRDRCTFLYGAAIAAGASPDDLRGTISAVTA